MINSFIALLTAILVVGFSWIANASGSQCPGAIAQLSYSLELIKGPTGPEHGAYNFQISWLQNQTSSPLQLHIWRRLSQPGGVTDQMSSELGQRGLLIPNGGLCASTCGVNLMNAIRSYYGINSPFATIASEIHYIVNYVSMRFGHDARTGLMFDMLADVMNHLIQVSQLASSVIVESLTMNPRLTKIEQLFPYFRNSVPILAIKGIQHNGTQAMYHAMVVTAFNGKSGEITLMDPMNPWQPVHAQIYRASWVADHWAIRIDHPNYNLPYYFINDVLNILSIR